MTEAFNRHVACNQCRQRKVRCDGRKPICRRCASSHAMWMCAYEAPARRKRKASLFPLTHSTLGVPTTSETGDFDYLTSSPPLDQTTYEITPLGVYHGPDEILLDDLLQQDVGICSDLSSTGNVISELANEDYGSCMSPERIPQLEASIENGEMRPSPPLPMPPLPHDMIDVLFSAYFNSFHRTRPIVENQKQLFNVTHGVSCDAMALRYAICAHAAPACPEFSAWAVSNLDRLVPDTDYSSFFYRLARASLDQYDLEIGFNAPSLRVLQATILIGLYELQQAEFGRAWLTASRAGWLTQALKLHLLDSQRTTSCIDAADIADARRALWLTIDVTSFLSLGGRVLDSISIQEISTLLPQSQVDQSLSIPGLRISDVFRRAASRPLSAQEGICVARMLSLRIVAHVKMTKHAVDPSQQPYNFWTNQHRLEEMVRYISSFTKVAEGRDVKSVLDLMLKALMVVLQEAALKKLHTSTQNGLDQQLNVAEAAALQHALEIADIVQTSVVPDDLVLTWAVYVAVDSLLRYKQRSRNQRLSTVPWSNDEIGCFSSYSAEASFVPTTPSINTSFASTDPSSLADALVLDSVDTMQSTLLERSRNSPIAAFFLNQATTDSDRNRSDGVPDESNLGLAEFATWGKSG